MPISTYAVPSSRLVHETKVDFSYRSVNPTIHVVQYDKQLPIIAVTLYVSGKLYTLPATMDVNIKFGKRDKTFIYKPVLGCNADRTVVYFEMDEQMTFIYGLVNPILELSFVDGGNVQRAGSSSIAIEIERNPIQESDIQSTNEYIDLTKAVEDVQQALQEVEGVVTGGNYFNKTEINLLLDDKVDKDDPLPTHTHTKSEITDFPASMPPTAHTHTKSQITDFPTSMPPTAHAHNDIYYTETEVDTKLAGKANTTHTHTKSQITDFPTSMPPTAHTHDDRYYTESEVDTKLGGKANTTHSHDDIYYTETEVDTKLAGKANTSHTHTKSQITDFPASMPPTAHTHTKSQITDFPTSMPPTAHAHNDIYYTETEIDTKLGGKANTAHTHTKSQITDFPTSMPPTAHAHTISEITDFPTSIAPAEHNHDDRYYTETEIDTKLAGIATEAHNHDDRYYTETEIDTKLAGIATEAHNHNDIYYTETEIDTKLGGKANTTHAHTKEEITDFPTSMPPTAHTHTKSQITDFPASMPPTAHTHTKSQITDFPTSMPPTAHTHTKSQITDFPTSMPPTAHAHNDIYYTETEIDTKLGGKVDKNAAITAGTHPKITYDAKGLVTSGGALVAGDIPNLNASKINAGTFVAARIPTLAASKIGSGIFLEAMIPELSPTKIRQSASSRFVTDVEKLYWDGKQDKLVAGDNITIDENNVISSIGGIETVDWEDVENKPQVVTLADAQTISGAKTFSRQVKITHPGFNPSLVLESDAHVTDASGSIMADMIRGRVTNDNGKTSNMFIIGTYGVEDLGDIPRPHYMYLDSRMDGRYDNATLKVDAQNRVGVATGSSRPTEALDVGGKIRMRTQTVAGDDDTIVVTKGYMDAAINTLNHDIVLIPDTAFTITQAYFNKTLIITSSSNVTITVPTKIVEDIEKGFFCDIVRYGTGEVTFSGAGIVLNSAGPLSIDAQYIAASLIKIDDNNEWLLIGGRE